METKTTTLLAATTFALSAMLSSLIGCDGPVEKGLDCATICNEVEKCVGGDSFDEKECRQECREDADQDAADRCQQCLSDQDSCTEAAKCSVECADVGFDLVWK